MSEDTQKKVKKAAIKSYLWSLVDLGYITIDRKTDVDLIVSDLLEHIEGRKEKTV